MIRDREHAAAATPPIAIVGVSALFPGSTDARGFWRDILAGKDLVTDVPPTHWLIEDYYHPDPSAVDKTYGKRGAFLPFVDFDPREFGIPPSNIASTDTAQLLALIVAKQVLTDALGSQFTEVDRSRVSVILGVASATELVVELGSRLQRPIWVKALRESGLPEDEVQAVCDRIAASYVPWTEGSFPGLLGNVVAGRIANRFDLGGTNCVIDAACASSLSALHLAMLELQAGTSDMVITGGVDALNDILMYECFSKTPALSPTGDCRPFSARADGTILGEGLGMVALRRLADAEAAGERIYALIRGVGTSSDGRTGSVYAPAARGQARALRRAYEAAGYGPDTVELVEAHGTGTRAGDAAEFEGLKAVFGEGGSERRQWCALGSIKSQIGHTKAAAGSAGLFKAVMALHHKVLPPTIKVEAPNPALDLETSPFHLNVRARPWIRDASHPRRASVSSFGFGGSNYHVTLEEYRGAGRVPGRIAPASAELVLFGDDSAGALVRRCRELAADPLPPGALAHHARRTQSGHRADVAHRLAILAADEEGLRAALLGAADRIERFGDEPFALPTGVYYGVGPAAGGVGFLFPGQGSQRVGVGADLAMAFDGARAIWDAAAATGFGEDGVRLHEVVFPPPAFTADRAAEQEARLTATEWAQPALGAASFATLALLRQAGVAADALGGHSFGELTALCAAGAITTQDLLAVARRRGELMAAAAHVPGAMTALTGEIGDLPEKIRAAELGVTLANHNSPRQVVYSGTVDAIDALERWLDAHGGATYRRLQVGTAFHSPLVAGSVEPFRAFLESVPFAEPNVSVYANATASTYPPTAAEARDLLARQIAAPVRFAEQIEAMHAAGIRVFVEVGPGSVLTGMVEQILAGRPGLSIATDRKGVDGVTGLRHCIARLIAAGVPVDPAALLAGTETPADPYTRTKAVMSVPINGANYGRPYPPAGGAAALPGPNPPREEPRSTAVAARDGSGAPGATSRNENAGAAATLPGVATPAASVHPTTPSLTAPPSIAPVSISPTPSASMTVAPAAAALPVAELAPILDALRDMHREVTAAQTTYQQAMAESHIAYLRAMGSAAAELVGLMGGQLPAALPPATSAQMPQAHPFIAGVQPTHADSAPQPVAVQPQAFVSSQPPGAPQQVLVQVSPQPRVAAPPAAVPAASPPPVASHPQAVATASPQPPGAPVPPSALDLKQLLLTVVAEKTGYPEEVIDLDLELEAGLGVDSIKRVEILSEFRDRAPHLPEIELSRLAGLRTLGDILAFMQANAPAAGVGGPASPSPTEVKRAVEQRNSAPSGVDGMPAAPSAPAAPDSSAGRDLRRVLLEVVAEKTGYPEEVIDLDLELEAGLGVDSIKRVEILSAFRDRAPDLPEIELSKLAALRTLAEILAFMTAESGAESAAAVSAAVSERAAPSPAATLDRFVPVAIAAPPTGFAAPGVLDEAALIAVTGHDGLGIAPLLVERLLARGIQAVAAELPPAGATGVIDLSGLSPFDREEVAITANVAALRSARAVAERFAQSGGVFVTVQDSGGDFGLSGSSGPRAWSAGMAALARTAAAEWPAAFVKAIDLEVGGRSAADVADAIVAELLYGGPELDVALSAAGGRHTLVHAAAAAEPSQLILGDGDVVVASGGGRGVTAACLIELARHVRLRFALLGRATLEEEPGSLRAASSEAELKRALLEEAQSAGRAVTPLELGQRSAAILAAREVRATVRELEKLGSAVRYLPADVSDADAVAAALADVRRSWGSVAAVVHGAGVLADSVIARKTDAQVERVFRSKIDGLKNLLAATRRDPLRAICLFSSIASRVGNPGQSDYAMANEVLNKVAEVEAASRPGCVVRSIAWGPLDGGMVTPALRDHFGRAGVPLISLAEGAAAFVREMSSPGSVEVVLGKGSVDGALGGARRTASVMDVVVDAASYPELSSHRIEDVPVLPVVIALEWFVRAAQACRPGRGTPRIRDLKVLKGVRLEGFENGGDRLVLEVAAQGESDASLDLRLRSTSGVPHYTAVAEFTHETSPALPAPAELSLGPWVFRAAGAYDGKLFHGPDFQAIRDLHGVSELGASALLAGAPALGWNHWRWRTDPVALDGALQLARLWGIHTLGQVSLPTRIGSVTLYAREPTDAPIHCTLVTRSAKKPRTVSDIALRTEAGSLIAELRGVEMHLLSGHGD